MDARVGILMRNGEQVFYGFISGVFENRVEKSTPDEVVAALDDKMSAPAPKIRAKSLRPSHRYIVHVTVKFPSCDDYGTDIEVYASNTKEAITSARKRVFMYYDRHDGAKTYVARRA
jgi:hypothetical protein